MRNITSKTTPKTPPTTLQATERELRHILMGHLPGYMEGIATAQASAVMAMIKRRDGHRKRVVVNEPQRHGMRLLSKAAYQHLESATPTQGGSSGDTQRCGMCRNADGSMSKWPCPVWESAELLGAVATVPVQTPDQP